MKLYFIDYLEENLRKFEKLGTINELSTIFELPLEETSKFDERLKATSISLFEVYTVIANGFGLTWSKDKDSKQYIGGQLKFITIGQLTLSINEFYDLGLTDEDFTKNPKLKHYHILDQCTPETSCGFLIKPEGIDSTLYYANSDMELFPLDLDYHGYTEMAVEAKVFYYWQLVLLHYNGTTELGKSETETFKKHMPELFPDFSWEKFIEKYENLRLSNK